MAVYLLVYDTCIFIRNCILGYLFSYMTLPELLENLSYVLMDESHSNSLGYRCLEYLKEIIIFIPHLLLYMALSFLIIMGSRKYFSARGKIYPILSKPIMPAILILTIMLFSLEQIGLSLLGDANQFYLYFRFLVVLLLGIVYSFLYKKSTWDYFLLGIFPGFLSVLASAAITNMTFEISLARSYIAVMALCFIVGHLLQTKFQQDALFKGLAFAGVFLFLISLLVCKLLLVRVTGCIPISVKMHTDSITEGPVAGLLLKEELAAAYNENTAFIRENITEKDCLLYFGCENIYYLVVDAKIATPSTQGTAVFNETYLQYFEKYPDKIPNVVLIDKSFDANPEYYYSVQNQIVLDWIMEEFENATVVLETDRLILMRK